MLQTEFYTRTDVVQLARELLGKVVYTSIDGIQTAGIITETEAYHQDEKACHAYNGKRTRRTGLLFQEGGRAYVYLCYGIHHLFNIVTGEEGTAEAVLIRAVIPYKGQDAMLDRRSMSEVRSNLSAGPGTLSQALGITTALNGYPLSGPEIWLEDAGLAVAEAKIEAGPRIGVDYAGEDAKLPWRFLIDRATVLDPETSTL